MTCGDYNDLMMAYLDGELDEEQRKNFEAHLSQCEVCQKALEEFTDLKGLTDSITLSEPEDRIWEQYWDHVYNRAERSMGWMIFSISGILLLIYGGLKLIEHVLADSHVAMFCKVCLVSFVIGVAVLFVSILRERLHFWKSDRYKDVRR